MFERFFRAVGSGGVFSVPQDDVAPTPTWRVRNNLIETNKIMTTSKTQALTLMQKYAHNSTIVGMCRDIIAKADEGTIHTDATMNVISERENKAIADEMGEGGDINDTEAVERIRRRIADDPIPGDDIDQIANSVTKITELSGMIETLQHNLANQLEVQLQADIIESLSPRPSSGK